MIILNVLYMCIVSFCDRQRKTQEKKCKYGLTLVGQNCNTLIHMFYILTIKSVVDYNNYEIANFEIKKIYFIKYVIYSWYTY